MDSKLKKILIGALVVVAAFCAYILTVRAYYKTTYGSIDRTIVETEIAARSISVKDLRGDTSNNTYGIRSDVYDYIQSQTDNYTNLQKKLLLKFVSLQLISVYDNKDNSKESIKSIDIALKHIVCLFEILPGDEALKENNIVDRIRKKQYNNDERKIVFEIAETYYNGHSPPMPSAEECKALQKEVDHEY